MSLEPGIHDKVDADAYHAGGTGTPSLSSSIARILVGKAPLHAWAAHPILNPRFEREEDAKFDVGTAAHALMLEGEDVIAVWDESDDWRKKDAQEFRERMRLAGRIPLLRRHAQAVYAVVERAHEQLDYHEADPQPFTVGRPEQTLVWEEKGVLCRARLDWLRDDHTAIDDYKTTSASADPMKWERTMYGMGADIQVAFYRRGVLALTGVLPAFRFIVQETYQPYALSVVELAPSALALAEEKVDRALELWKRCLDFGEWPAYSRQVASIELPAWEETRWFERLDP